MLLVCLVTVREQLLGRIQLETSLQGFSSGRVRHRGLKKMLQPREATSGLLPLGLLFSDFCLGFIFANHQGGLGEGEGSPEQ